MAIVKSSRTPAAATAGIGHNSAPIPEIARDEAATVLGAHDAKIADLCGAAQRASATDQDSAGRCADLIKMINARMKAVGDDHARVKRPYLDAGREVDAARALRVERLEFAKQTTQQALAAYLREEREKATPVAPASVVHKPVVTGDYGARTVTRTERVGVIVDARQLPDSVINSARVVDAMQAVVNAMVRAGVIEIAGVEITTRETTHVR
jgi:hypothetical protein